MRCVFTHNGPALLTGDREALSRLVSNLVSNAVLYTEPDTTVEIEVGSEGEEAFLEVRDQGPGIAADERDRIFERFVRLEAARERHPEGSGLGLAIVEQVANAHQGLVHVLARPGGGTIFRVELPKN